MSLMTCQTSEARCYSRWYYPWKQRCQRVSASHQQVSALPPLPPIIEASEREQTETAQEQIDIPLPALVFEPCQDGDERLQGIARLRAIANDLW
jgi:hypothetical protein